MPRLGCFMAVPLVYNSCLTNEALEDAIEDYTVISKEIEEQAKQKAEYDAQQAEVMAQKQEANEPYEEEPPEWKDIKYAPFKTFKEEYIICLDTLGQDRQFSDEEKRFTLGTVKQYIDEWEKREQDALTADRDRKLAVLGVQVDENAEPEEDQAMRDAMDALDLDPDYFIHQAVQDDPIFKQIFDNQKHLIIEAQYYTERDEYKKVLSNIKSFRVLKMTQIIQAMFFLNKFERDDICEPKTNKMSWKKAKELFEK